MAFKVLLHPNAAKDQKKIDEVNRVTIKKSLEKLKADPWKTGKTLHPSNFFGIRSGDYRAIYEINSDQNTVTVLFVGHRKKVYDNFSNLL